MRWTFFYGVTIAIVLIWQFEWKQLKKRPAKDKAVFVSLLLLIWLLSMLDLPNTPGPTSLLEFVFKPLHGLLDSLSEAK